MVTQDETISTPVLRIAGPVGAGKTTLISGIVPALRIDADVSVIQRDVHQLDDKFITEEFDVMANDRTILAMRNTSEGRLRRFLEAHDDLDLVILEDVGTNATMTADDDIIDYLMYVVSISEGNNIPYRRENPIKACDLLILNKADLADAVDADLDQINREIRGMRDGPFYLVDSKTGDSIDHIVERISQTLFNS